MDSTCQSPVEQSAGMWLTDVFWGKGEVGYADSTLAPENAVGGDTSIGPKQGTFLLSANRRPFFEDHDPWSAARTLLTPKCHTVPSFFTARSVPPGEMSQAHRPGCFSVGRLASPSVSTAIRSGYRGNEQACFSMH